MSTPEAPPPQPLDPHVSPEVFRRELFAATPRVWATPTLVGLNATVFAVMVLSGVSPSRPTTLDLVRWGADFGPLTTGGEWWRMLTNTFIHIGIIHIAMNMYGLWQVGYLVERLLGNSRFLVTYLLAGLAGSFVSLAIHPDVVSAGASGAVFGVYGALVGYLVRQRGTIPRPVLRSLVNVSLTFIVLNLIFGLKVKGIDMAAHAGGFVGGAICAGILARPLAATAAVHLAGHLAAGGPTGRGLPPRGWRAEWLAPLLVFAAGLLLLAGLCALLPRPAEGPFPGAV